MPHKLTFAAMFAFFAISFAGCAPRESFSWIDRNCFVADWTNHHSCLSCCCDGNCQHAPPPGGYEMLVLGNPATTEDESEESQEPQHDSHEPAAGLRDSAAEMEADPIE
jgi:hypothetical protein